MHNWMLLHKIFRFVRPWPIHMQQHLTPCPAVPHTLMSTLEPLLPSAEISDPSVTRLLLRNAHSARVSTLLQRATAVRPSMSVILTGTDPVNDSLLSAASTWQATGARLELFAFNGTFHCRHESRATPEVRSRASDPQRSSRRPTSWGCPSR